MATAKTAKKTEVQENATAVATTEAQAASVQVSDNRIETDTAPAAVNLDLLRALAEAHPGSIPVGPEYLKPLEAAGYAEGSDGDADENGNINVTITEDGKRFLETVAAPVAVNPSPIVAAEPVEGTADKTKVAREKPIFSQPIKFELPDAGKRGGARPEVYPFDSLEVGGAFFIAATKSKPDPVKEFASTVASATRRYANEVPGETVVNRRGKVVPKLINTREFKIRRIDDGAPFGEQFRGIPGAVVGRIA